MTITHRAPIVVDIDGTRASWSALRWASNEADHRYLPLQIVCHYPFAASAPVADICGVTLKSMPSWPNRSYADEVLTQAAAWVSDRYPATELTADAIDDSRAAMMLSLGERADSLVVGVEPPGPMGLTSARSVARTLATLATRPVILVRDHQPRHLDAQAPIVVVGPSGRALDSALAYGFEHARHYGAPLRVVRWWPTSEWHRDDAISSRYVVEAKLFDELNAWRSGYPDVHVTGAVQPAARLTRQYVGAQLLVLPAPGERRWYQRRSRELRTLMRAEQPTVSIPPAWTTG